MGGHLQRKMLHQKQRSPVAITKVFMIIKKLLPSYYSVKGIPSEHFPMKMMISKAFGVELGSLNLATKRKNSLIDFLSAC